MSSKALRPFSARAILRRLMALARASGVVALTLAAEAGPLPPERVPLLSALATGIPTMVTVGDAAALDGLHPYLEMGARSILSPALASGPELSDFIRGVRDMAGDGFGALGKWVRLGHVDAYRRLPEILDHPDFLYVFGIHVDRDALAVSTGRDTPDPAVDAMVREICAWADRLGKPVAVGGHITPETAPAVARDLAPDSLATRMLTLRVAGVPDISAAVRGALEFEALFEAWHPEAAPPRGPGHPGAPRPVQAAGTPDSLTEALESRTAFKFIIGIQNGDCADVRFLTQIYALAGADIIDVAARPDVVAATVEALAQARRQSVHSPAGTRVMVSLALERDPHVQPGASDAEHRKIVVPTGPSALVANVRACLDAGAEMVELHASDSDDPDLTAAVAALSALLGDRYLSVCLGAEGFRSPRDVIHQAGLVREIHGPHTMIQAEGLSLQKGAAPATSVQGLALAQALLAKTSAYIVVAGGGNYWTRNLADLLGVPVHAIAAGTYARKLVEGLRREGAADGPDLAAAVAVAQRFAAHVKGGSHRAL